MKNAALILLMSLFALFAKGQLKFNESKLLDTHLVDLKSKEAFTAFLNNTSDTLKLYYTFFNWLPYTESKGLITIPAHDRDTLKLSFNFPDIIRINNWVVYNSPGSTVTCTIQTQDEKPVINFSGSLKQENDYYRAYTSFLGDIDQESRPFYTVSNGLTDWNLFPAKADSITQVRLQFLNNYASILPDWFKKHEHMRLIYNKYYRLYNTVVAKEFNTGHIIKVDDAYYSFEKVIDKSGDMVMNEAYLSCMGFYCLRQGKLSDAPVKEPVLYAADKWLANTDIGDVVKMRTLGSVYSNDRRVYDSLITSIKFKQPERKQWIDSLIQTRMGMPYIGKKPPAIIMNDANGNTVSLDDFTGKVVILNFWAVWCGPCIKEFPSEKNLYDLYKNKGLVIVNICVDSEKGQWQQMSERNNLTMINLYTQQTDYAKLLKLYNLGALPRSVLIGREGKVLSNYYRRASLISHEEMRSLLKLK